MLRIARQTPNIRAALAADPIEAMTVESLARTTSIDGYLGLNRSTPRSRFDARVSTGDADYRASALSLSRAVGDAIRLAEAAL